MNGTSHDTITDTMSSTIDDVTADGTTTDQASEATVASSRYLPPDPFSRRVLNPIVTRLVKMGVSMRGARELQVRGRSSGEWRSVPVNVLAVDGVSYLVAPRGTTQWVRNLRAAGVGRLRAGRRVDEFTAVEIDDADKTPILRAYLRAWAFEVGRFFDGVDVDSPDEDLAAVAAGFPVFRVVIA